MKTRLSSYSLTVTTCLLTILCFSCVMPTRQPSYFDKHPEVLKKQYTADEMSMLEKNFKANPLKYSQAAGDMFLWRMHQKSPEFALEFAQTPEIADGTNPQEAKAMSSIYDLIKGMDIPSDLFKQKTVEGDTYKIIIELEGTSDKKIGWDVYLPLYGSVGGRFQGKLIDAKPVGFEPGEDRINYQDLREGVLSGQLITPPGDKDSIIVTLEYPYHNRIILRVNGNPIKFTKEDIYSKNQLQFKKGLEGILLIKNASGTNLPELYAIRDMVLSGEGNHRYSSPLQALLWGYMDGKFKEGDNPLKNYQGAVEFVRPIWGEMKGEKWDEFNEVASRLNSPEIIEFYLKTFFRYDYALLNSHMTTRWYNLALTPKQVFEKRGGVCIDAANFACALLTRAGYDDVHTLTVESGGSGPRHTVAIVEERGKIYKLADTRCLGLVMSFQSYRDAANSIGGGYYFIDGRIFGW